MPAMAPIFLEPAVRDFRIVVGRRHLVAHRQRDQQSPADLSAAPDFLGLPEPGLESGLFLSRDRPQSPGVVCAAGHWRDRMTSL